MQRLILIWTLDQVSLIFLNIILLFMWNFWLYRVFRVQTLMNNSFKNFTLEILLLSFCWCCGKCECWMLSTEGAASSTGCSKRMSTFWNKPKMAYSRDFSKMAIKDYHGLTRTIKDCQGLSKTIKDYQRLSWTVMDCHGLS